MHKEYICRKYRLMNWLENHGFSYKETRPKFNEPKKVVWVYTATESLYQCVEEYYSRPEFLARQK